MATRKKKTPEQLAAEEAKAAAAHQGEGREEAKDRVDKPAPKQEKGEPIGRDTPSALALEKVGPDGDGEEYAAEKKKHRWG
jgi:hypothetical protein